MNNKSKKASKKNSQKKFNIEPLEPRLLRAAHSDILIGAIDAIESFMSIVWWTSLNMDWMLIHISLLQSRQIIFPKKLGRERTFCGPIGEYPQKILFIMTC